MNEKLMKPLIFALPLLFLSLVGCTKTNGSSSSVFIQEDSSLPKDGWSYSSKIAYVRKQSMVTGSSATVNTAKKWRLTGTDLGFCYYDPSIKRFYSVFGDTSSGNGGVWNSNITLYTDNLDFSKGIEWQGMLPGQFGAYSSVTPVSYRVAMANNIHYDASKMTCEKATTTIPTGAAVVNGVYYLFYMEVGTFQANGEWDVYAAGVTKSTDKGQSWSVVDSLRWISKDGNETAGNATNFGQIFPLVTEDYLYIYGIPGGRSGGVKLGRVALDKIEDFESYEYLTKFDASSSPVFEKGTAGLTKANASEDAYIVQPSCGELCVSYEPYMNRYMMTYMQNNAKIVMRLSKDPWGTWGSSDAFLGQSDMPGLYGGSTCPQLFEENGQKIYLLVSEWSIYNVHLLEVKFN